MLVSGFNNSKFIDLANNNPSLKELKNTQTPKSNLEKSENKTSNASYVSATYISDYQNSGNYVALKISQKLNSPNERPSVSLQLSLSGYGIGGAA